MQIYNDNIHDLLAPTDYRGKANLKLREDGQGRAYVDNLTEVGHWHAGCQQQHHPPMQKLACVQGWTCVWRSPDHAALTYLLTYMPLPAVCKCP